MAQRNWKLVLHLTKRKNVKNMLTILKMRGILYELSQKATESQRKQLKEIKKVEKSC